MLLDLFKAKPIIDADSKAWIDSAFAWALENFDNQFFSQRTELILPTKDYFPDPASSVEEMAANVFRRVSEYCGLEHWPFKLVEPQNFLPQQYQLNQPLLIKRGPLSDNQNLQQMIPDEAKFTVSYDPIQLKQPQVMVANYAAMLSSYLVGMSGINPPGDADHRAPAVEILAIFMGFGVMFTNTAYAFRGGCGSCHVHAANRVAVLSENECVYALALFAQLKGIEPKKVTPHLKKHLRGLYKQAFKQLEKAPEQQASLQLYLPQN